MKRELDWEIEDAEQRIHSIADKRNRQLIDNKRLQIVRLQLMMTKGEENEIIEPGIRFVNHSGEPFLIAHFPGRDMELNYPAIVTFNKVEISVPDNITIITFATRNVISESLLIQQLDNGRIPYLNAAEQVLGWVDTMKVPLTLEALTSIGTEYALLLDGFDVLLCGHLDSIFEKFEAYQRRVLFGASKHPYPNIVIERIERRDWFGPYKHVNAGTVFGKTADLSEFYNRALEVQKVIRETNEQVVVRKTIDQDSTSVGFDYNCSIFQTFGWDADVKQDDDVITIA